MLRRLDSDPRGRRPAAFARLCVLTFAVAAVLAADAPVAAQDLHPSRRPSPLGVARTHIGDTYVKVVYGRPYMRNRRIFGTPRDTTRFLVPFGEVWRTGANEATELTTTGPLMVGGRRLPAGTYSIFTVPGPQSWSVRFSPLLGLDGTGIFNPATGQVTPAYDPAKDVLQLDVPVGSTPEVVDQFTIEFEETAGATALVMRWERTEIRIPIDRASS